jgi:hypothetical protein
MSNARRNRDRRPGRRPPFRDPKPRILVVSEGEYTEPDYLRGFAKACRNPRVTVEIAPEHGVPKTVVEVARDYKKEAEMEARREKDDNLAYESVWCVFDIDDHPRVGEAQVMARDNDIRLAISNPCIELWLLLHFRDNPGMQHRAKIENMLKKHVPDYDKHVDYETYSAGYEQAVVRAKQLDKLAENANQPGNNPTTGVYRLTELIRDENSESSKADFI